MPGSHIFVNFILDRFHSYCRLCCWHYHKDWMRYYLAWVFQSRQLGHFILHKTENNQLIVVIHHLHLYLQLHFYLYENRHLYFGHVRLEILDCIELKAINSQSLEMAKYKMLCFKQTMNTLSIRRQWHCHVFAKDWLSVWQRARNTRNNFTN